MILTTTYTQEINIHYLRAISLALGFVLLICSFNSYSLSFHKYNDNFITIEEVENRGIRFTVERANEKSEYLIELDDFESSYWKPINAVAAKENLIYVAWIREPEDEYPLAYFALIDINNQSVVIEPVPFAEQGEDFPSELDIAVLNNGSAVIFWIDNTWFEDLGDPSGYVKHRVHGVQLSNEGEVLKRFKADQPLYRDLDENTDKWLKEYSKPRIHISGDNFIVTWKENERNALSQLQTHEGLYAAIFTHGQLVSRKTFLNDTTQDSFVNASSIATNNGFLTVWLGGEFGYTAPEYCFTLKNYGLYGQMLDKQLNPVSGAVQLDDNLEEDCQDILNIAIEPLGNERYAILSLTTGFELNLKIVNSTLNTTQKTVTRSISPPGTCCADELTDTYFDGTRIHLGFNGLSGHWSDTVAIGEDGTSSSNESSSNKSSSGGVGLISGLFLLLLFSIRTRSL